MTKQYFGKNKQEEEYNIYSSEESLNIKLQRRKIYYAENEKPSFTYIKTTKKESFKERITSQGKIKKKHPKIIEQRIRSQWTQNFKHQDNQSVGGIGFISIRAMTINPAYSHKALKLVCNQIQQRIERIYGINFKEFGDSYEAPENSVILGTHEDKALNDYTIHYEYFLNRKAHYGIA